MIFIYNKDYRIKKIFKEVYMRQFLFDYIKNHKDILECYFNEKEFVLVVENIINEEGEKHYVYCYNLMSTYFKNYTFKIFDKNEFEGMKDYYLDYEKIY
jgi:hypothetical protein